MNDQKFNRTLLAQGITLALGASVFAPAMAQNSNDDVIEEIVTVGIRSSMTSSMNLKRDAQGVKDGIIAEDIGKFPSPVGR